MAYYNPGEEPEKLKKRMKTLFDKLDSAYPDKIIIGLHNDHKKWGETVTTLYRELGYPDGKSFLEAYGYQYDRKDRSGGRTKSVDPEAIIKEFQEKYPNGSPFKTAEELFAGTEYESNRKTIMNQSKEVFGMPLGKYLLSIGLLQPKVKKPEEKPVIKQDNNVRKEKPAELLQSTDGNGRKMNKENDKKDFIIKSYYLRAYVGPGGDVRIPVKGVKHISINAFRDCKDLKSVIIPDGVVRIGDNAFEGCSNLTSVDIPDSVERIFFRAFKDCKSLLSVTIPKNVDYINEETFSGCSSLRSITIPDSVYSIREKAFYGCSSLCNVKIPDGQYKIWPQTFYGCSSLKNIEIPNGVEEIGDQAFYGCSSLESVNIPSNVTRIGENIFGKCSGLKSIILPEGSKIIKKGFFGDDFPMGLCDNMDSLIKHMGDGAIRQYVLQSNVWEKLTPELQKEIFFSKQGITFDPYYTGCISAESADSLGNEILKVLEKKATVKNCDIAGHFLILFPDVSLPLLQQIYGRLKTVKAGAKAVKGIEGMPVLADRLGKPMKTSQRLAYYGYNIKDNVLLSYKGKEERVSIPEGITKIGDSAFDGCDQIKSVYIPDSVTTIGADAFFYCKSLNDIIIPESIEEIGKRAFSGCSALVDDQGLTIVRDVLYGCFGKKEQIVVPQGVRYIEDYGFKNNNYVKSIILPQGIERIGSYAFESCTSLKSIILPQSLEKIGECAFRRCTALKEVSIPESVIIEEDAFAGCKSLADEQGFVIVNDVLFDYIGKKKKIVVPENVKWISGEAIEDNNRIVSVYIPDSVEHIGEYLFFGCDNLTEVRVPEKFKGMFKNYRFRVYTENDNNGDTNGQETEYNPISDIWRCYDPYIKGKKEDVERLIKEYNLNPETLKDYKTEGNIVSFGLAKKNSFSTHITPERVMDIIRKYPELFVTCILAGDLDAFGLQVAVVISQCGCSYITDGEIIGTDAGEDDYIMSGFSGLFKNYSKRMSVEDPHSGIKVSYSVKYKYPYLKEWKKAGGQT